MAGKRATPKLTKFSTWLSKRYADGTVLLYVSATRTLLNNCGGPRATTKDLETFIASRQPSYRRILRAAWGAFSQYSARKKTTRKNGHACAPLSGGHDSRRPPVEVMQAIKVIVERYGCTLRRLRTTGGHSLIRQSNVLVFYTPSGRATNVHLPLDALPWIKTIVAWGEPPMRQAPIVPIAPGSMTPMPEAPLLRWLKMTVLPPEAPKVAIYEAKLPEVPHHLIPRPSVMLALPTDEELFGSDLEGACPERTNEDGLDDLLNPAG